MRKSSCRLHHGSINEEVHAATVMDRALCGYERATRKFESEISIAGEEVRVLSNAWRRRGFVTGVVDYM